MCDTGGAVRLRVYTTKPYELPGKEAHTLNILR